MIDLTASAVGDAEFEATRSDQLCQICMENVMQMLAPWDAQIADLPHSLTNHDFFHAVHHQELFQKIAS